VEPGVRRTFRADPFLGDVLASVADAPQMQAHHLPHVSHEGQLLVWHQQPHKLVPLIARHHRNVPAWQPGYRCCGSGRAQLWRSARNPIREFENLAHDPPIIRRPGTQPPAENVPGLTSDPALVACDSGWSQRWQLWGRLRMARLQHCRIILSSAAGPLGRRER
jgi:hypothetical protein